MREHQAHDTSFLTGVTQLCQLPDALALTLPTSVVALRFFVAQDAVVTNPGALTTLDVVEGAVQPAELPKLQSFAWRPGTFTRAAVPVPPGAETQLRVLSLFVRDLQADLASFTGLTCLGVVGDPGADIAQVTTLAHLRRLVLSTFQEDPLDLSGLVSLTGLIAEESRVARLPTSLVECRLSLWSDFDFSTLAALTWLRVTPHAAYAMTFPAALRRLVVGCNAFAKSNIADIALERFECVTDTITPERLRALPTTLLRIKGTFEPPSLEDGLVDLFPWYGLPQGSLQR